MMAFVRPRTLLGAAFIALGVLSIYWRSSWTSPVLLDRPIDALLPGHDTVYHTTKEHQVLHTQTTFPNDIATPLWDSRPQPTMTFPTPSTAGSHARELVIAKQSTEDTSWTDSLSDLVTPNGDLKLSIYVVDDPESPLHPPANKGHEAMVYFTFIINRYDSLPDTSVFMHGHAGTWHNNDLLNWSSAALVRHLNPDRVRREGYMQAAFHHDVVRPLR